MSIILTQLLVAIISFVNFSDTLNVDQTKENIYIFFDSSKGDVKKKSKINSFIFSLKDHDSISKYSRHQLNYFVFDSLKDTKENVKYDDYKNKLINGIEATKKVNEYLKNNETRFFITPYYYNNYFNKIYIYERIDKDCGILYEVNWNWVIN